MSGSRQDRLAIKMALKQALKTGQGSCVLADGQLVTITQQWCGSCDLFHVYLRLQQPIRPRSSMRGPDGA